MNPEEILVSIIALRDLMAKRNPDQIFLRDTTQTRGSATDPFIAVFLRDAPDGAPKLVPSFARNSVTLMVSGGIAAGTNGSSAAA